jgi:hypothetical protein
VDHAPTAWNWKASRFAVGFVAIIDERDQRRQENSESIRVVVIPVVIESRMRLWKLQILLRYNGLGP